MSNRRRFILEFSLEKRRWIKVPTCSARRIRMRQIMMAVLSHPAEMCLFGLRKKKSRNTSTIGPHNIYSA